MGAKRPVLGYPSMTAAILAMREKGMDIRVIAEKLDISPKTAQDIEHSGLKTRAGQKRKDALPAAIVTALERHAQRRGLTVWQLAVRILATVAADDLVDAVLDDRHPVEEAA
jgi:hypothetical protein